MNDKQEQRTWWNRMSDRFRLVILRDADLSEVRSYRITGRSIYILLSSFILLLAIGISSLLVFTPLKQWIPGYGDVTENYQFQALERQVEDLVETIDAQETYINGMRQLIGAGDIPTGIAAPDLDLVSQNQGTTATVATTQSVGKHMQFTPPLRGKISAGFLNEKDHLGVDIVGPKDSAIAAVKKGAVISAVWNMDTGYAITLQHENNVISVYKHNKQLLKKIGDQIKEGEAIAIIGNTGHQTTGPHLHFELWMDGLPVDPAKYINFD